MALRLSKKEKSCSQGLGGNSVTFRLNMIDKSKMEKVCTVADPSQILELTPFHHMCTGIVTTGSEMFNGRIKDTFTPAIQEKLSNFDIDVKMHILCDDDEREIAYAILKMLD